MRPVAPMPHGAAVDTKGLKSCVTVVSGELSMTRVALELLEEELPEALVPPDEDPHAASAPARVVTATAPNAHRAISLLFMSFSFRFSLMGTDSLYPMCPRNCRGCR